MEFIGKYDKVRDFYMVNFQIQKISDVVVQVKNLEKSIHFYENILMLHKEYVDDGIASFSFRADKDATKILLHVAEEPEITDKGMVMYLSVDDVVSAVNYIKEAGFKIYQEPIERDWGVKEAVIVDPDGYKIWLAQPL